MDIMDMNEASMHPLDLSTIRQLSPPHSARRVSAQSSIFTVHNEPTKAWEPREIKKLIIPSDFRIQFRTILYKYGITSKSLFPGLDGLCKTIKYLKFGGDA